MTEGDFLSQLLETPADKLPKPRRNAPKRMAPAKTRELAPQKTLEWDGYDDLPDRGSFAPPVNEADFRNVLGSKTDEATKREPGAPPPSPPPLGRPDSAIVQTEEQEQEQNTGPRKVYMIGFDPRANAIAFELAGCEFLDPVKLLAHKRILMNTWEAEGKRLMMRMDGRLYYRYRAETEWVGKGRQPASDEPIEQLIVTLPCWQTKTAIENILHRIDNNTTICLIQDGLGVVEELNETLFQDPRRRPTFILGHMTTSLGFEKRVFYSSVLRKPGKLFLTALERGIREFSLVKFHPPVEARTNASSFLHTLTTVPNLGAGAYSIENFLLQKLPAMVFHCVIEPLAIALDGTYRDVLRNEVAMQVADELLEEIFSVIWAMPQLVNGNKVVAHCGREALRRYAVQRTVQKGDAQSQLLSRVRAGKPVDIDYLNGYFVKRGQEFGIKMPQNEMMINVVKARVEGRKMDIEGLIPMETVDTTNLETS